MKLESFLRFQLHLAFLLKFFSMLSHYLLPLMCTAIYFAAYFLPCFWIYCFHCRLLHDLLFRSYTPQFEKKLSEFCSILPVTVFRSINVFYSFCELQFRELKFFVEHLDFPKELEDHHWPKNATHCHPCFPAPVWQPTKWLRESTFHLLRT